MCSFLPSQDSLHPSPNDYSAESINDCPGTHTVRSFPMQPSQGLVLCRYTCHFLQEFSNLFTKKLSYLARLWFVLRSDFANHSDGSCSTGWWHVEGNLPTAADFQEASYRRPHSVSFGGGWSPALESPSCDVYQDGFISLTSVSLFV